MSSLWFSLCSLLLFGNVFGAHGGARGADELSMHCELGTSDALPPLAELHSYSHDEVAASTVAAQTYGRASLPSYARHAYRDGANGTDTSASGGALYDHSSDQQQRLCPNNEEDAVPPSMLAVQCQCAPYRPGERTLTKRLTEMTAQDVRELRDIVNEHGVVVLSNVSVPQDEDLLHFTKLFGEMIELPAVFAKQAHESNFIGVITNVFENGTVDTQDKTAGYWHNDGDFWQNNYLYNFLFSRIVPETNGETGFLDLRSAYKHVACSHRELFNELSNKKVVVKSSEIPDFRNVNMSLPDAHHHILGRHVITDDPIVYYGHRDAQIRGQTREDSERLLFGLEDAITDVDYYKYMHRWSPNQMLIWDNTLVMHRAMGNVGSQARRLLRTQAKIDA